MEKNYFLSLSEIEKIDFVWNYGDVIHEIETTSTYDSLFVMNDFFVEIHLDKSSNEIVSIFVQEQPDQLYRFVKHIQLDLLQHN